MQQGDSEQLGIVYSSFVYIANSNMKQPHRSMNANPQGILFHL
jgi:hypothetical protein